jgi:hypothetical protein
MRHGGGVGVRAGPRADPALAGGAVGGGRRRGRRRDVRRAGPHVRAPQPGGAQRRRPARVPRARVRTARGPPPGPSVPRPDDRAGRDRDPHRGDAAGRRAGRPRLDLRARVPARDLGRVPPRHPAGLPRAGGRDRGPHGVARRGGPARRRRRGARRARARARPGPSTVCRRLPGGRGAGVLPVHGLRARRVARRGGRLRPARRRRAAAQRARPDGVLCAPRCRVRHAAGRRRPRELAHAAGGDGVGHRRRARRGRGHRRVPARVLHVLQRRAAGPLAARPGAVGPGRLPARPRAGGPAAARSRACARRPHGAGGRGGRPALGPGRHARGARRRRGRGHADVRERAGGAPPPGPRSGKPGGPSRPAWPQPRWR